MRWFDVAWLYLLIGVACAVAVLVREGSRTPGAMTHAAMNLVIWPLWAPLTLVPRSSLPTAHDADETSRSTADPRIADAVARIAAALHESIATARDDAFAAVLPATAATRILDEVGRVAARHTALTAMLRAPDHEPRRAVARVEALAARGDNPRALATARLHADNVERLARLRDHDLQALEELAELTAALRTQLVLARFAGTAVDGASDIVGEVWARVEGLGEALDATAPRGSQG
jgi:hypothetical protein